MCWELPYILDSGSGLWFDLSLVCALLCDILSYGCDILVGNMYVVADRQLHTSGSVLMNLLMNGRDVSFGYQLQPDSHDVSRFVDVTEFFFLVCFSHAPILREQGWNIPQILGLYCLYSRSMRNQILHGDETRWGDNFYAPVPGQKFLSDKCRHSICSCGS